MKKTIEKQHAWIFGNRIKNLQRKLNPNKSKAFNELSKKSVITNFLRYSIILFSLIVLCQVLNAVMSNPKSTIKKYMPRIFIPYIVLLNDWCHILSNVTDNLIKNIIGKFNLLLSPDLKDMKIIQNDILPLTWIGLMLEIILLTRQPKSALWKANELLSWIILIITSLNTFHDDYFQYVSTVQVSLCLIIIRYVSYLKSKLGHTHDRIF